MFLRPKEKCEGEILPGLTYWGFGTELLPVTSLPTSLGGIPITSTQPTVPFWLVLGDEVLGEEGSVWQGSMEVAHVAG